VVCLGYQRSGPLKVGLDLSQLVGQLKERALARHARVTTWRPTSVSQRVAKEAEYCLDGFRPMMVTPPVFRGVKAPLRCDQFWVEFRFREGTPRNRGRTQTDGGERASCTVAFGAIGSLVSTATMHRVI
jgi:hypothetical protein